MTQFVAALPMYDWPEARKETDALWARIRDMIRGQGIDAPERLARCNRDVPAVPGGIRDAAGNIIAPDPATLPPDELDLHALWHHPGLIFAQTCWGPMELGLANHVRVIGQPDYSAFAGCQRERYSSAILMRKGEGKPAPPPGEGSSLLPLERLCGKRFAYNGPDSLSGIIALSRDLDVAGESLKVFSESIETGSHRASVRAVAEGRADVCAIDCRTWDMARRFEPAAAAVEAVGWTALRKGLPYIAARTAPAYQLDWHSLQAA